MEMPISLMVKVLFLIRLHLYDHPTVLPSPNDCLVSVLLTYEKVRLQRCVISPYEEFSYYTKVKDIIYYSFFYLSEMKSSPKSIQEDSPVELRDFLLS